MHRFIHFDHDIIRLMSPPAHFLNAISTNAGTRVHSVEIIAISIEEPVIQ